MLSHLLWNEDLGSSQLPLKSSWAVNHLHSSQGLLKYNSTLKSEKSPTLEVSLSWGSSHLPSNWAWTPKIQIQKLDSQSWTSGHHHSDRASGHIESLSLKFPKLSLTWVSSHLPWIEPEPPNQSTNPVRIGPQITYSYVWESMIHSMRILHVHFLFLISAMISELWSKTDIKT